MAEETGKASENKTTTGDVTGQPASEDVKLWMRQLVDYLAFYDPLPIYVSLTDAEYIAFLENRIRFPAASPAHYVPSPMLQTLRFTFHNAELALAAASATEDEASDEEAQRREALDEAVAKVLINSSIAEVERAREAMLRDDEEIERLKQETRAILTKLAA